MKWRPRIRKLAERILCRGEFEGMAAPHSNRFQLVFQIREFTAADEIRRRTGCPRESLGRLLPSRVVLPPTQVLVENSDDHVPVGRVGGEPEQIPSELSNRPQQGASPSVCPEKA